MKAIIFVSIDQRKTHTGFWGSAIKGGENCGKKRRPLTLGKRTIGRIGQENTLHDSNWPSGAAKAQRQIVEPGARRPTK